MSRLMRIVVALAGGVGLLTTSACTTVPGSGSGSSFEQGVTAGYASSGSASSGSSSPEPSVSSTVDLAPDTAIPTNYREDRSQSTALTSYLDKNRLPMVGAEVFACSGGDRQVIIYGFVATDFGKDDAAAKARQYLGDPALPVVNWIVVRPELLASGDSGTSSSQSPAEPLPSAYSDDQVGQYAELPEPGAAGGTKEQSESALRTVMLLIQLMSLFL